MGDVVFRRIHGRIIPIRKGGASSKPKKQSTDSRIANGGKSAAATVLGVSTALYSGKFAAIATEKAARIMNKQHDATRATEKAVKLAAARAARKAAKAGAVEQGALGFMAKQHTLKFRPALEKKLTEAAWSARKSDFLFKSRLVIRRGGAGIAGALLGYAGIKGIEAATGKDASKSDIAKVVEFAVPLAAGIAATAYYGRFIGIKAGAKKAFSMFKSKQLRLRF